MLDTTTADEAEQDEPPVPGPPHPTRAEWWALGLLLVAGAVAAFNLLVAVPIGVVGFGVAATSGRWDTGESIGVLMLPLCAEIVTAAFLRPILGGCGDAGYGSDLCAEVSRAELPVWPRILLLAIATGMIVSVARWLAEQTHDRPL